MEKIEINDHSNVKKRGPISAILGNFDGFHIGHQELCLKASIEAKNPTAIIFFDKDYDCFLYEESEHLCSLDDKILFAEKLHIDNAFILKTSNEFYSMSAEEFISLLNNIGVKEIFVGTDFKFGANRGGDNSLLAQHFDVHIVKDVLDKNHKKVSSTNIKKLIKNGKIGEACINLGRLYEIKGEAIEGLHNGEKIGIKTINLSLSENYVLPKDGVYFGITYVNGIPYKSLINVGRNPTVGVLDKPQIESHLLDFPDTQLYGKTIYVQFIKFIREEQKFASLIDLKKQIEADIAEISKEIL